MWVKALFMSHFFFLQNTPFGNIFLHLHIFSSILPVRETFLLGSVLVPLGTIWRFVFMPMGMILWCV
jgi:hypothetical protein